MPVKAVTRESAVRCWVQAIVRGRCVREATLLRGEHSPVMAIVAGSAVLLLDPRAAFLHAMAPYSKNL